MYTTMTGSTWVLIWALPFANSVILGNVLSISVSEISHKAVVRRLNKNTDKELKSSV
jgi:hypothetical protein